MLIFIQKLNMCCLHTKEENIPNNPPRKILAFKYTENIAQMHAAFLVKYAKLKCVTPKSLTQIDIKYSYKLFLMLFYEKKVLQILRRQMRLFIPFSLIKIQYNIQCFN